MSTSILDEFGQPIAIFAWTKGSGSCLSSSCFVIDSIAPFFPAVPDASSSEGTLPIVAGVTTGPLNFEFGAIGVFGATPVLGSNAASAAIVSGRCESGGEDPPDCDGICDQGEASTADCDGVCAIRDPTESPDCDGTCDMADDPLSPDCPVLTLPLDLRPGQCPNDYLPGPPFPRAFAFWSQNVHTVALPSTDSFDASSVDFATLELCRDGFDIDPTDDLCLGFTANLRVPPVSFEDVSTPFESESCECHAPGADGLTDLLWRVANGDLVELLELDQLPAGEVELVARGRLIDGTFFEARDCLNLIVPPPSRRGR